MMRVYLCLTLLAITGLGSALVVFSQSADKPDPLVRVLQTKGILTETEARAITANASPEEQRDRLATLLRDKGVISTTEFDALHTTSPSAEMKVTTAEYKSSSPEPVSPKPQSTPPVIAAVTPVRLMGIDAPKREGLIPDINLGTGARLKRIMTTREESEEYTDAG